MKNYWIAVLVLMLLAGMMTVQAQSQAAGIVNGDFGAGLVGWSPDSGDSADWWTIDGVLVAHTRSQMADMAWIINEAALPAGAYNCTYDVYCKYGIIITSVGVGIGHTDTVTALEDNDSWVTYTTTLTTGGGLFRLGVWTATDSLVYFDNVSVDAVPEAVPEVAGLFALAAGLMGYCGSAKMRRIL